MLAMMSSDSDRDLVCAKGVAIGIVIGGKRVDRGAGQRQACPPALMGALYKDEDEEDDLDEAEERRP